MMSPELRMRWLRRCTATSRTNATSSQIVGFQPTTMASDARISPTRPSWISVDVSSVIQRKRSLASSGGSSAFSPRSAETSSNIVTLQKKIVSTDDDARDRQWPGRATLGEQSAHRGVEAGPHVHRVPSHV